MKRFILVMMLLTLVLVFAACKGAVVEDIIVETETIQTTTIAQTEAEIEVEAEVIPEAYTLKEGQVYAPFTGLPVDAALAKNRPVVVMMDNYYEARPQSGLIDAEVIYEILAEGMITRYMAVFQTKSPESIGPIRSSRMYYIRKALEYDPLYVHVGGSPEALKTLKTIEIGDVDGLKAGSDIFWRKTHKKIPNNMYSSMAAIRKQGLNQKHKTEGAFDTWLFHRSPQKMDGDQASEVKLVYLLPTAKDAVGYYSTYSYDVEKMCYTRGFNGMVHRDETNSEALTAMNIIIQFADHRIVDDKGRREIDIIGSGDGYYITMGKKINIVWKKSSDKAITRFYDEAGIEISLNPGVTWIQIIESPTAVTIE